MESFDNRFTSQVDFNYSKLFDSLIFLAIVIFGGISYFLNYLLNVFARLLKWIPSMQTSIPDYYIPNFSRLQAIILFVIHVIKGGRGFNSNLMLSLKIDITTLPG